MCQSREVSVFDNSTLLFVGECIEVKHYVLVVATSMCGA